jgi:hypothetical protein
LGRSHDASAFHGGERVELDADDVRILQGQ